MKRIFNPKTIALFGASNREESIGYAVMKNIIGSGYEGIVYPINLKRRSVFGIKAYKSLKDTNDKIDLAVIATPYRTAPKIVEHCGKNGVGGIVIISGGFVEAGEEGKNMLEQIKALGKEFNIRIVGPNCLGFIKPSINLNVSFANKMALPGNIAFISQSGALCTAILDWSVDENVGFSHFISLGGLIDVGFGDLIDYLDEDPQTSSIIIYMESMINARKFMSAARAYSRNKPILILKAGKSLEGARVAQLHTGNLAGNAMAFEAAFRRAGVVSVDTIDQLFNGAMALSKQPRPNGNRLAIVTNAGGPGVLATDLLIKKGGALARLSNNSYVALNKILPPTWSHDNPIYVLGNASHVEFGMSTELCLKDENVDAILVILTPQAMTDPKKIAEEIVKVSEKFNKTVLATWMGSGDVKEGVEALEEGNIPIFLTPEKAVTTFMDMVKYSKNLKLLQETPPEIPTQFVPKTKENRKLLNSIINQDRFLLDETEAKTILENYHIQVTKNKLVFTEDEAGKAAVEIRFPLVMKIASKDILHKSTVNGVQLNINSEEEARSTFTKLKKMFLESNSKEGFNGVVVEEMINKKFELVIGMKKDPIFGPLIIFGMGGVAVEVFKDLEVGLPPLNMVLALRMIESTKIYQLLKGYKGMEGVDIQSLQFLLYKFANLIVDFPEIKEIDINPYSVDMKSGFVLDAKIILDEELIKNKKILDPHSHLVISPYPSHYTYNYKMKNGSDVIIRPIKPEDEPLEREMFSNLSKQTQYFRFFGYIKDVTHEMLVRYTNIDYEREMALMAEIIEDGVKKMVGVVRIVNDLDGRSAEFAIVVADPWQGQGLGSELTNLILDITKKNGIKRVYASVLKANGTMIQMFRKRGFEIKSEDMTTSTAELLF